jgi:hypothetical protein
MNRWTVADTTARDALAVTDGDVFIGAEARVLADGSIWRAIASGTGSSCWDPVTLAAISDDVQTDVPLAFGTWTPTVTAVTNVDSGQYQRIGNIVSCAVRCNVDATASGSVTFRVSLPIASDLSGGDDLNGIVTSGSGFLGRVTGDSTNNAAEAFCSNTSTGATNFYVMFKYRVI